MPRSVTRCPQKSGAELDVLDELNCVYWIPMLPGTGWTTFDQLRRCWQRHGKSILAHYIAQRPGTRPFALWALGELPLPPLKHEPRQHSLRVTIEGTTIYSPWHYFGSTTGPDGHYCAGENWGQFEYLRGLRLIDDSEARSAKHWIDDRHYVPGRSVPTYQPLADD